MKTLEDIKNNKPNEFSDSEEVKEFVTKNYETINKAARDIEKEPEKLKNDELMNIVNGCLCIVGVYGTWAGGMFAVASGPVGLAIMLFCFSGAISLWTILSVSIRSIIRYCRVHNDSEAVKNLTKIKDGLKKVNTKKLPDSYKKKISEMISTISDAETEIYAKLKKVNE